MSDEINQLSEREREILKLVATGATNQQIAGDLGISINTVKVHVRNIFGKIGAASRTEATLVAMRAGLIEVGRSTGVALPEEGETKLSESSSNIKNDTTIVADSPTPSSVGRNVAQRRLLTIVGTLGGLLLGLAVLWFAGVRLPSAMPQPTTIPTAIIGGVVSGSQVNAVWTAQRDLPVAISAAAASSVDGRVYIIGGQSATGVSGKGWSYDPAKSAWLPITDKPTPVSSAQAVVLDGKIWVPGGENNGKISDKLEVFDPRTNTWSQQAAMPEARSGYGIASIDGRLYVFGGWDGSQVRDETFVYDPGANSWTKAAPMPTARAYTAAASVDGKVYVLGGENSSGTLTINEVFTPALDGTGRWDVGAPMTLARSRFSSVASNNYVIVLGGAKNETPARYDVRSLIWEDLKAPALALGPQPAVTTRDASIYVAGGDTAKTASPFYEMRLMYQVSLPLP